MGHLTRKIDHFASQLCREFCLGEPKFINKKAIRREISKIIFNYVIRCYVSYRRDESGIQYINVLTAPHSIVELTSQLLVPLMIIKKQHVGEQYWEIDLNDTTDHRIMEVLTIFFKQSHRTMDRNCRKLISKKRFVTIEYEQAEKENDSQLGDSFSDEEEDSFIDYNTVEFVI